MSDFQAIAVQLYEILQNEVGAKAEDIIIDMMDPADASAVLVAVFESNDKLGG